ncbi:MAG: RpiB/LacA/LacB family sugar-phosphate isomerase [Deltaproteobacteria bacterium]|nr:RpiB/LacA/LacB family sugar-phosphate isomerase [Deltaproteobacteria bacterium]
MRIALAADHAGFEFKARLARELGRLGHDVTDFGTGSTESCDYPDHAIPAARAVAEGKADRAILICTNGIGMAMTANRIPGVRAALIYNARTAVMTRKHHDSNALCLGAGEFPAEELLAWVRLWLDTEFEGGRHARRVGKFEALDEP